MYQVHFCDLLKGSSPRPSKKSSLDKLIMELHRQKSMGENVGENNCINYATRKLHSFSLKK